MKAMRRRPRIGIARSRGNSGIRHESFCGQSEATNICREETASQSNLLRKSIVLRHRFWSAITGADIPLNCNIGGGLLIPHPNGIVIHPAAVIGVNCLIFQQVTIGTRDGSGVPKISDHVDIGAGAKILGPVEIGPHAKVGANAVIIEDVERGSVALGIYHGSNN